MLWRQQSKTILVILAGAGVTSGAFATLIDFEGTGAPTSFMDTLALRDTYAGIGVHFDGPAPQNGGAILNEGGNFGVDAFSGTDFLAFNDNLTLMDGGTPTDPQEILFDGLQASVSIYAAGGYGSGATFRMDAYDQSNQLVDSITVGGQAWVLLVVADPGGIARVMLTEITNKNAFVYDDLEFFAVPDQGCFDVVTEEIVCHADGTTFTVNVEGLNACTGGTSMFTFTASGGAVGEEMCFTLLVDDGGFCCSTEICVTIPDCTPDGGTVVDFEDPIGAELTDPDGFSDEGFDFIHGPDSQFEHLHWGMEMFGTWAYNGTNIVIPHGDMIMTASDGSPFDLVSVCLAGASGDEDPIHVIGTSDKGMITVIFELDGVFDGPGPLVDFETFFFPPGFTGLTGARFLINGTGQGPKTGGFAVDNIVVGTAVPEPDCSQPPPSDVSGDGTAGIDDVLMLLAAWGSCADCVACPADFDSDCSVGILDLLILLGDWG